MSARLILITLFLLVSSSPGLASVPCQHLFLAGGQSSVKELETNLESQYREIQKLFASPPRPAGLLPADYHRLLREWQDDLAQSFVRAAATVSEILARSSLLIVRCGKSAWRLCVCIPNRSAVLKSDEFLDRAKYKPQRASSKLLWLNTLMKRARQTPTAT